MSSNRPYTFDDVAGNIAEDEDGYRVWKPRPNTTVYYDGGLEARVYLYGSRIASMYGDGTVKVEATQDMSNTVRNRLNDVLFPLGWRLRQSNGRWYLAGAHGKQQEYITGQIVRPVNKKEA